MSNRKKITLDGHQLKLKHLRPIAEGAPLHISAKALRQVRKSRQYVMDAVATGEPMYGINTGFGYFARERIDDKQLRALQLNILKSHASGQGKPLSKQETRLAMALRLNVLTKGLTGVREELCLGLLNLIEAGIYPLIPEQGSVGASGDLAPLAHLALPLVGLGKVHYRGKEISAKAALKRAKLQPLELQEKEGLSLVNGTQIMLAVGGLALSQAPSLLQWADKIAALTFEGLEAHPSVLDSNLHEARRQIGQIATAQSLRKELQGSKRHKHSPSHGRLQDPYSLRCTPQIHGPSKDTIEHSIRVIERELNAATDNPLVFPDVNKIISGGNFHGQALAMAFDIAAIALAEIGSVSERRLELLLNPHFSHLPAFLSPDPGICSGYMASQYLSASLVNENKLLANPACTDSIPGNVGVEDHVSMGMTSARKLRRLVKNVRKILAVELIAAAQAVDLREIRERDLGKGTRRTYQAVRRTVPTLTEDRIISDEITLAAELLANESI